jgi:hypothetical protein
MEWVVYIYGVRTCLDLFEHLGFGCFSPNLEASRRLLDSGRPSYVKPRKGVRIGGGLELKPESGFCVVGRKPTPATTCFPWAP